MATLIQSLEAIKAAKQKPTDGELFLLEFLVGHFDDEAEVYFQPCLNGDRPDVVVMSPKSGVIIIEVKDWNLDLYNVDEDNKWSVSTSSGLKRVKSPFAQVYAYKKNLFDIHGNGLLEKNLKNPSFFKIIRTYVYFHHGSKGDLQRLYQSHLDRLHEQSLENNQKFKTKAKSFDSYEKSRGWLERGKYRFERDFASSLCKERLQKIAFPLAVTRGQFALDESVYNEFKRLLNPPHHYASEGKPPSYSKPQSKLIQSTSSGRAKICGLAGSGKTVVLAGRAVNAHKRHGGKVLVLTFNITLGSYIHDKISAIRDDFPWSAFEISTYHRFITTALNNAGIEIEVPKAIRDDFEDPSVARLVAAARDQHLESTYYSNPAIFENEEIKNVYDTILIDEIQDYKPAWIKLIRACFLAENGEMVLFGDEKQNIYKRALDGERRSKVVEGFGSWLKLTKSFRYVNRSPLIPLADSFQRIFLLNDYTLDSDDSLQLTLSATGIQVYEIFDRNNVEQLAEKIIDIAKVNAMHPNDISIISSRENILQELDYVLRTSEAHKERTLCAFPSIEVLSHHKFSKEYKGISAAKKKGFNLNSGVMKLSSIHSFKGFESPVIVLLVCNQDDPEMVFTGLTRAKESLVVFMEHDCPYFRFFNEHLNRVEINESIRESVAVDTERLVEKSHEVPFDGQKK